MTNVGVWGYLIFVSEKENDERRNGKVACEETSPPRSAPDCEACSVWALKVMGDTCFPSHLPTSSWVAGRGGGSQPPQQRSTKPPVFVSCLEQEKKNHWKGDETAKFVYQGGKLISEVKGKACMPLKKKKESLCFKALFEQQTQLQARLKTWIAEPNNCATFVILTRRICRLSNCSLPYSWLHLQLVCMALHANIGESLPPCGDSEHFTHCLTSEPSQKVCKIRQNNNHLCHVKAI